ncbi:MAG: nuclear transport factor 2 family protein [Alphaproteobacteria bacterium]
MMIERACEQLSLAYAYHLDFGNFDALAKLFADDAVLHVGRMHYRNLDEIRTGVRQRYQQQVTRHVCTNLMVDVIDETRAVGVTYVTIYRHQYAGPEPSGEIAIRGPSFVGHYEDEFVLDRLGWRFASRRLNLRFRRGQTSETERTKNR